MRNCPKMNVTGPYPWEVVTFGSGNDFMPSSHKPLPEPSDDSVSCCDLLIVCYLCQERYWFQCIGYNYKGICSLTQLCPSTAGEVNISCTITSNDCSSFNLTTCKISSGDFKFWFFRTEIIKLILQETLNSPGFEWRKWHSGRPVWLPMRRKILAAS